MSTDSYYLAGRAANAVLHATAITVSSEDANPDFQKAALQNGWPWHPFRFGSLAANPYSRFDTNMVRNGGFEDDSVGTSPPTSWRTISGTPAVVSTPVNEGARALELTDGEAAGKDVPIVPGNQYRITAALRGDGTKGAALYLVDLRTGKYYDGTGNAWGTTKAAVGNQTAASYATFTEDPIFEGPLDGHVGPSRARLILERSGTAGAGTTFADSVYMFPKITFASLHYHTIPTAFPIEIRSSTDPAWGAHTVEATLPQRPFRNWVTFAGPATLRRYWAYQIIGTPFDAHIPWIGQPAMGQHRTWKAALYEGSSFARLTPIAGLMTDRMRLPTPLAEAHRNRFQLSYLSTAANLAEAVDQLLGESRNGVEPVVFVPHADRHEVIYGRAISESHEFTRISPELSRHSLTIEDDTFGTMTG